MRIFISYRREMSQYIADRIDKELVEHFGRKSVFRDVYSIEAGQDFRPVITTAVGRCDVLLAVIGPKWASVADIHGKKKLELREDYVRLELEAAIDRKIRIIPILSDGTRMPPEEELPKTLRPLVFINALEIRPARDFDGDMIRLLESLGIRTRSTSWIAALFKHSWIAAGTAILTIGLVFGLGYRLMISAKMLSNVPTGETPKPPVPIDQDPSKPHPTSTEPPQPPPTEHILDDRKPPLTPLTSADDLKKVEEQIECGDQAKARELLRQLKSRCADDPVLSFYDAVAAALAAGNWSGEPEALISSGRILEEKESPASNRERLDPMLKCLLLYLKQEDKARFQHLLGRSIE
jgi:TIR domain